MVLFFLKAAKPELSDDYLTSIKNPRIKAASAGGNSPLSGLLKSRSVSTQTIGQGGQFENYLRVVFVRNPLDRLISAWSDKFHAGR